MVLDKIVNFLKLIFLSNWIILTYFILAFALGFWLYKETEDEYKAKGRWIFYFFVLYILFIGLFLNYFYLWLFLIAPLILRLKGFRFYREAGSIVIGALLGIIYNSFAGWLFLLIPVPLVYSNLICEGMDGNRKIVNAVLFSLFLILFALVPIKL